MRRTARGTWLAALALTCLLAVMLAPAGAPAQSGADQEYNLDLPGSGANQDTPPASASDTDTDTGGFPVVVVLLIGGAAVLAGFAGWRLRKGDESGGPEPS
jgi:hypothetical protein